MTKTNFDEKKCLDHSNIQSIQRKGDGNIVLRKSPRNPFLRGKLLSLLLSAAILSVGLFRGLPAVSVVRASNPTNALVGAIRWDGWVGDLNTDGTGCPYVGQQVETALGPNQYHFRLPFFGVETGTDSVQARELTQSIMDQEIAYAKNAGINYWAFDFYPDNSGLDTARHLYDSSAHKNDIQYSFILGTGSLPPSNFSWLVGKFTESNYVKVWTGPFQTNRPLVYIFGGGAYTASDITNLRNMTIAAQLGTPYIVAMDFSASSAASDASAYGADAISSYATGLGGEGPYSGLISQDQSNWESWKATGWKVVPWVTTGWDPRPQIDHPVCSGIYCSTCWTQDAQPSEIATDLQNALNWVNSNLSTVDSNAVIMYAWNEFAEGGWISPTLFTGRDRLGQVQNVTLGTQPFVLKPTLGTLRNDVTTKVGFQVNVGATALTVRSLGRWVVSGNTGSHTLRITRVSDGVELGSVTVNTSGATAGVYLYGTLASAVTLAANSGYYITSDETSGGDQFYDNATTSVTSTADGSVPNAVYWNGASWVPWGSANSAYGPVDFQYSR